MQSLNEELTTVNAQLRDKVEDLEAAQNDIQNLLNSGEIATIFLDREFRIRRFTPAVTDLLSLIPADVGRPFSDFSQSFSDPGLLADAKKVLDRLIPAEAEVQAVGGAWYLRRILPYRAQDNRIDGVVITFADVTPLKTAERHAARLAAAVRDSNDAIIVQGLDGRIVEWNRGAESIYGYDQATALGMNVEVLVPAIDRRRHAELIERLFAGELAQAAETTRLTKDGRVIEVWLTATVLRDESGKPISMATTERDITARNRQAAKLEQALEALQTQAKLLAVAKESAERANQAKSQFLSHMSHELRTPLNAIIGFSDAIREQTLGPLGHAKYADYVNSIHTAGTRLLNLIGDLLDLAKIEAGAFELNEEDIDLGAMIDDCFGLLGRTAEMAQVALRRDLPAGLPPFWADERQLRGGLLNLISNSIKFTGKGGQVTVAARLENKKTLVVTVSDSGVGMSPAEANKAMAPFGQIDNVMGRKNRGSGLGLPLVKAMMDLHGGTMEIDSKPGVGTTVTLRFPPERTVFV
jgi:two-component system CheB/CheR fusion protein